MNIPAAIELASWPTPVTGDKVVVEDRAFLIEHPEEGQAVEPAPPPGAVADSEPPLPFWTELWPAARMLAKALVGEPQLPAGHAIEIGCGLGLPGIVALSRGLRVTFTDWDANALRFAARNALLNGFDQFRLLQFDWHSPPSDLRGSLVLGSDLLYQATLVEPLVKLIRQILEPGGLCLLVEQDRVPTRELQAALGQAGFEFTTRAVRAAKPGGLRHKGTLYRVRG